MDIHNNDLKFIISVLSLLSSRSRATRARVGCVIWHNKKRTIIGIGYNGTLPGSDNTMEVNNKTLDTVIHAEINALSKTSWWQNRKSTLFVTHSPCLNCSKEIVKSGIKFVYYLNPYGGLDGLRYLTDNKVMVRRLLAE